MEIRDFSFKNGTSDLCSTGVSSVFLTPGEALVDSKGLWSGEVIEVLTGRLIGWVNLVWFDFLFGSLARFPELY